MSKPRTVRATKSELEYIQSIEGRSVFDRLDRGELELVEPRDYPESMKRYLARLRPMLHIKLPPRVMRALRTLSQRENIPIEDLARRWLEEAAKRHAV